MRTRKLSKFAVVDDLLVVLDPGVQEPGDDTVWLSDISLEVDASSVLVAGCGSGLLALRLARKCESVNAIDLNPLAASCCHKNACANGLGDRIAVTVADMRDMIGKGRWDLVVSNPPQLPTLADAFRNDWVSMANDGGEDGRKVIDWLCGDGTDLIAPGGTLVFAHFAFLGIERTISMLQSKQLEVDVSEPLNKPLGVLSGERLSMFADWVTGDYYSIVALKARKAVRS
ncbi:HemK2/MTQ2 family protein methyltransferase [Streptomyces sp. NPDC023998]|uniref:HemK2/MTQ2 family protein methyltransferase n=1 Tax=Streptomyces sp. NPDC023998 TaxID=3154597 RepID=UPI0033DDFB9E